MKDIVIWGAGFLGKMAWTFYKDKYNIVSFVDIDQQKWGKKCEGILIESPNSLLSRQNITVVVPKNQYTDEICEQLNRDYHIEGVLLFEIKESAYITLLENSMKVDKQELIVSFKGGLGNQLFQYAFMQYYSKQGRNCTADLSYYVYPNARDFDIEKVFSNIRIKRCNPRLKKTYVEDKNNYYEEPNICYDWKEYPVDMFQNVVYGYVDGYFQSMFYPNSIREELLMELSFSETKDLAFEKIKDIIKASNSVSIHIRRGDYLSLDNDAIFGGICTEQYYDEAMKYISELKKDILWVFFSNDIDWVKNKYYFSNAIYICNDSFEDYHDWYDMSLMSFCHHNIIANSTFSWWGAWLNRNDDKIVIAPKKWVNFDSMLDICPKEWIRI